MRARVVLATAILATGLGPVTAQAGGAPLPPATPRSISGSSQGQRTDRPVDPLRAGRALAAPRTPTNTAPTPDQNPIAPPTDPRRAPRSIFRVDNRIIESRTDAGVLENASNSWLVQFRPMSAGGVTITRANGAVVRFDADGAQRSVPTIDSNGTAVTYPEVWPGVDVQYEVSDHQVKENIVVKRRPDRADFPFSVSGGELRQQPDGTTSVIGDPDSRVPGADRLVATLGAVTVKDSSGRAVSPDQMAFRPAVAKRSNGRGSRAQATFSVGASAAAWQSVAPEAYPIIIDPITNLPVHLRSRQPAKPIRPRRTRARAVGLRQHGFHHQSDRPQVVQRRCGRIHAGCRQWNAPV